MKEGYQEIPPISDFKIIDHSYCFDIGRVAVIGEGVHRLEGDRVVFVLGEALNDN